MMMKNYAHAELKQMHISGTQKTTVFSFSYEWEVFGCILKLLKKNRGQREKQCKVARQITAPPE